MAEIFLGLLTPLVFFPPREERKSLGGENELARICHGPENRERHVYAGGTEIRHFFPLQTSRHFFSAPEPRFASPGSSSPRTSSPLPRPPF